MTGGYNGRPGHLRLPKLPRRPLTLASRAVPHPDPTQTTVETPLSRYRADQAQEGFLPDPAQERIAERLDALHHQLVATHPRHGLAARYLRTLHRPRWPAVNGLYLWGGVGRGKTYLMDCFHDTLPFPETLRAHFHPFMAQLHTELAARAGAQDPLRLIARQLAKRARVICFDEFFVSDITDAMLLGTLFQNLFAQGVTLVATSNVPPQDLYRDGLQRERFLPAIALLERHAAVVEMDAGEDFRLRALSASEIYHAPLDAAAEAMLARQFSRLCPHPQQGETEVTVLGRCIPARGLGGNVAWFDFSALCGPGRSPQDYLELAERFETLLVSGIPILDRLQDDAARRLIHLVDIAYDHRLKLIITAQVEPGSLYQGERLTFEFGRTVSRLQEMSSMAYLAQTHRP